MELQETFQLRGCLEVLLCDAKGVPVGERQVFNTVVTAGRSWVLQQIASSLIDTARAISYLGIGTSTTAPATSQTALGSEVTRLAINSFDSANMTSNPPSWAAICSFNTNQGNTTLGEASLFNSSSGGTMFNRATFSTINKTTSNTLSMTFTVSN